MGEHLPCKQGVMSSSLIISIQNHSYGNLRDNSLKAQAVSELEIIVKVRGILYHLKFFQTKTSQSKLEVFRTDTLNNIN